MRLQTSSLTFIYLLLTLALSACDSDFVDKGSRYIERLKVSLIHRFTSQVSDNREELSIVEFLPPPNYSGNRDEGDRKQLVDGELVPPPMWVDKRSVGWFGETPVIIEALRPSATSTAGKIRIHAGKGDYADSALPRQIDVYTNTREGFKVAGTYRDNPDLKLQDKRNYWLEVPVWQLGQRVIIALHANSSYLNIDEIEFVPEAKASSQVRPPTENLDLVSLQDFRTDASARLRLSMELYATDRNKNRDLWRQKYGRDKLVSWVADPWYHRIDLLTPQDIDNTSKQVSVNGLNSEFETFAIGLYYTGSGLEEVEVQLDGVPDSAYSLLKLEHVLTSEGQVAFDPLVPVKENHIKIQSGWPVLAWFKIDLKQLTPGSHRAQIKLKTSSSQLTQGDYPLNINVVSMDLPASTSLDAVVWGYTSDMPIWRNPELAVHDQQAHYVNVWTIHPENIPGLLLDGKMEPHKLDRLKNDLALYKDKGKVRLYSGWTMEKNPLGINVNRPQVTGTPKENFAEWLSQLDQIMRSQNYSPGDWEFYPLDEPSGSGLAGLKSIAEVIRQTLPDAGIYTNPITTYTHPTDGEQLTELKGLIDSWQPMLSFARKEGADFFNALADPWGFYHNPPLPAKFAEPIGDYRSQGWWAWQLGAKSVGFWSYSDSTGSSVWDDFDGRRPDFSVVYERSGTLVSSRRWEGFAEGIEDYRLLIAAGLDAHSIDVDVENLDTGQILNIRQQALNAINP